MKILRLPMACSRVAALILCIACLVLPAKSESCADQADDHACSDQDDSRNLHLDVLFGAGVSLRLDDRVDFVETASSGVPHLVIKNDSRGRPVGMIGLGIHPGAVERLGAFVSIDLPGDSDGAIDGLVAGVNIKLLEHLGLAIGVGLHSQQELSSGFRTAAREYIPE